MVNGLINVFKEKGMTSHDCVSKIKKIFRTKKVGHGGTLDPNAEGVLIVGIGQGTKLLEYITGNDKEYLAELIFGKKSDTEDLEGRVVDIYYNASDLSDENITRVFKDLNDKIIDQVPPMYSSVKINGKKLYEYARKGQTIDRPSRRVHIKEISQISKIDFTKEPYTCQYRAVVSKGTYIRTLSVLIGEKIGVPALMGNLLRTRVGTFEIKDAKKIPELEEMKEVGSLEFLIPMIEGLGNVFEIVEIDEEIEKKLKYGLEIPLENQNLSEGIKVALIKGEKLISLGSIINGSYKINKNIFEGSNEVL